MHAPPDHLRVRRVTARMLVRTGHATPGRLSASRHAETILVASGSLIAISTIAQKSCPERGGRDYQIIRTLVGPKHGQVPSSLHRRRRRFLSAGSY